MGVCLHDHWSVPLGRVELPAGGKMQEWIAPRFEEACIFGRHFEIVADDGWGARGFVHFQFLFDEVSPYREIKEVLNLRQQRAAPWRVARAAIPMLRSAGDLLGVGIERIARGRLRLSRELPVVATLDFESHPHAAQRLSLEPAGARMQWDLREEDERSFLDLSSKARQLLEEFRLRTGLRCELSDGLSGGRQALDWLREKATDAFHLGGGLAVRRDGTGILDEGLRVSGISNLHVISAAAFARPGVVNPTHTLLALGRRYVRERLVEEATRGRTR